MDDENNGVIDALDNQEDTGIEDTESGEDTEEEITTTANEDIAKLKELAENQRIRAEKAEAKLKERKGKKDEHVFDPEEIRKQAVSTVREELEKEYLDNLEYPDDIKEEVRKIARLNKVSIKQALKDPYIDYKIGQAIQEERLLEGAVTSTRKSTPSQTAGYLDPRKFDLETEEGRTAWNKAKAKRG